MHFLERNIIARNWSDYEILDCGNKRKLERFGPFIFSRFEPEATWSISRSKEDWQKADAIYTPQKGDQLGEWKFNHEIKREWFISYDDAKILLKIYRSRHLGIFPEQHPQWKWIEKIMQMRKKKVSILNLFAYTGVATLFSLRGGAEVTHVDSNKSAITWAKQNIDENLLSNKPVHWLVDDSLKFVNREIRRGKQYDGIIMDPPVFGRGPAGEIWQFSKDFLNLLSKAVQLLSPEPLFMLCTAYNTQIPLDKSINIISTIKGCDARVVQFGKLIQKCDYSNKEIPQANYLSWSEETWS